MAAHLRGSCLHPRRSVPKALFFAVILVGIVYVVSGYAAAIGYGQRHVHALSHDAGPSTTLATRYWGANVVWIFALTEFSWVSATSGTCTRGGPR